MVNRVLFYIPCPTLPCILQTEASPNNGPGSRLCLPQHMFVQKEHFPQMRRKVSPSFFNFVLFLFGRLRPILYSQKLRHYCAKATHEGKTQNWLQNGAESSKFHTTNSKFYSNHWIRDIHDHSHEWTHNKHLISLTEKTLYCLFRQKTYFRREIVRLLPIIIL